MGTAKTPSFPDGRTYQPPTYCAGFRCKRGAQITFAGGTSNRDNELTFIFRTFGHFNGGDDIRAR